MIEIDLNDVNLERTPNDHKFKELILYIAEKSEGDRTFGATKLNKILFYSDFLAFLELGKAITWHRYQRLENGPAPIALLPVQAEMEEAREIARVPRVYRGRTQKVTLALREPDLKVFTAQEIAIVTEVIEALWNKNASEVSELSHQFLGWKAARLGEEIPYDIALIQLRKPTEAERAFGMQFEEAANEWLSRHDAQSADSGLRS